MVQCSNKNVQCSNKNVQCSDNIVQWSNKMVNVAIRTFNVVIRWSMTDIDRRFRIMAHGIEKYVYIYIYNR